MPTIQYPECHKNDIWNVPDGLFHISLGLMLGGKQAAKILGCCREILYRDADNLNLTVLRRNLLHSVDNIFYLYFSLPIISVL